MESEGETAGKPMKNMRRQIACSLHLLSHPKILLFVFLINYLSVEKKAWIQIERDSESHITTLHLQIS